MLELIARFLIIGALAFGGGQAALPLVERLAVADTGWLTPVQFATGVGLSYATPRPVLIISRPSSAITSPPCRVLWLPRPPSSPYLLFWLASPPSSSPS